MSSNFFAALADADDEVATSKKAAAPAPVAEKTIVEPSGMSKLLLCRFEIFFCGVFFPMLHKSLKKGSGKLAIHK
jgi:hypothetical protein